MNILSKKDKSLLVLLLIGIGLSIYGFIQKKYGLFACETDGCTIATSLIKINPEYLYIAAFIFFISLIICLIKFREYFNLVLYSGVVFESLLFSNLYFIHNEICIECFKMISLLILIGLISNFKYILLPISIFSASYLLNPIGEDIEFNNKYTLITKEDCPHCKNAKEYLQKQNINYSEINYKQATKFLNTFNIKSVPVLVLKKERSIEVINGDINIEQCLQDLNFAENKNNLFDLTRKNLSFNPLENGIIPQENPSGCSIDQKALDCEK